MTSAPAGRPPRPLPPGLFFCRSFQGLGEAIEEVLGEGPLVLLYRGLWGLRVDYGPSPRPGAGRPAALDLAAGPPTGEAEEAADRTEIWHRHQCFFFGTKHFYFPRR